MPILKNGKACQATPPGGGARRRIFFGNIDKEAVGVARWGVHARTSYMTCLLLRY